MNLKSSTCLKFKEPRCRKSVLFWKIVLLPIHQHDAKHKYYYLNIRQFSQNFTVEY